MDSDATVAAQENADSQTSRRVFINGSLIELSRILPIHTDYSGKTEIWIDGVGSHMKSDNSFYITVMPAATYNSVKNMLFNQTLKVSAATVFIHLGSSQVLESTRRMIIGQILDLSALVKTQYPKLRVIFSGVLPRPVDHKQTSKAVIEYNHAIKTAVNVAS